MLDIIIEMKYSSKEIKENEQFKDNRGGYLMLECDTQSKLIRRSIESEQNLVQKVKYVGNHILFVEGVPCNRGIKEMIRIIDSNKIAKQVYESKFYEYHELIDLRAQR